MKKIIYSTVLVLLVFLFVISDVYAVDEQAILTPSTTTVKPGDTFTVTLSIRSDKEVNAVFGKESNESFSFTFDSNKLELVEGHALSGYTDSNSGTGSNLIFLTEDGQPKTDGVYSVTFRVKDGVQNGTVNIATTALIVVCDYSDPIELSPTNLPVTISSSTVTPPDDNEDNQDNPDEPNDPDDSEDAGDGDEDSSPSPNANLVPSNLVPDNDIPDDSDVPSSQKPSADTAQADDGTTAAKPIPYTGVWGVGMVVGVLVAIIFAIVFKIKSKKDI